MFAKFIKGVRNRLSRSGPAPVPFLLDVKITRLRASVRRGGQGSDLAAAELRGITETILSLGAGQTRVIEDHQAAILNRAIGWRGGR